MVWIVIWDSQTNINTKSLINRCFNIKWHIATIRGTNMNLNISEYKNYWKYVICKSTRPDYIPVVKSSPKHTSLPSTVTTFLATHLIAVLQLFKYSVFYGRVTPIQLGLLWQSYPCQCLNTETSTRGNKGFTTETPSISYTFCLYIRLVVTL